MVVQRVDNWNAIYNIAIRYVNKVHIFKADTLSFKTNLSHGREEGYIRRTQSTWYQYMIIYIYCAHHLLLTIITT
jgi:hypothetical protein